MALSRSARITLLLAIDVIFFFIELIVGYAVGSLALVADSFHMLNDVMSLIVALYAIRLSSQAANDSRYSYGWQRAEILAALINGVFLLALCFSITMEALERFFSTPEISNPQLIVIVGSFGLASNIVGLFLFQGRQAHGCHLMINVTSFVTEHGHKHEPKGSAPSSRPASIDTQNNNDAIVASRNRSTSYSSLYGHPVATRASLVQTAQDIACSPTLRQQESTVSIDEETPLLDGLAEGTQFSRMSAEHDGRAHGQGHAHGSMNMQALVLHVLGDALGNVGVIATGLVIWLTTWEYKFYFDPVISLVITVIIFSSALPLGTLASIHSVDKGLIFLAPPQVRSASFILLQGVPTCISLDEVRASILNVKGVLSVHELHVWQLSETKIVASVHVMASRDHEFMPVASEIRKALHHHGIHSSTIQPEYHLPSPHVIPEDQLKMSTDSSCLIVCPADQNCDPAENACCRTSSFKTMVALADKAAGSSTCPYSMR
ncbi:cation efflux family-domain-containing protein [Chiua virens]|nr:cation efflux family-domain-containing protein [Chiua virens]